MEAIRSTDSIFINRWAKAEYFNGRLVFCLIAVSSLAIVLTLALVFLSIRPRPIYFVSGALDAGVAIAGTLPQTTVITFVSSWLLNWTNYTPVTIEDVYARAKRFMSPVLLGKIEARLKKDLEQVKRDNISSMYSFIEEPTVAHEGNGYQVSLIGSSGIFMGKEQIKTQKMMYRIAVRKVNPTDVNPYGLMIESIDQEEKQ